MLYWVYNHLINQIYLFIVCCVRSSMILRDRVALERLSEFLRYLAAHEQDETGLPALTDLFPVLGISVASLRQQLELAPALGFGGVRPRTGLRRLPYSFLPA